MADSLAGVYVGIANHVALMEEDGFDDGMASAELAFGGGGGGAKRSRMMRQSNMEIGDEAVTS